MNEEEKDYYEEIFSHGLTRLLAVATGIFLGIVACIIMGSCMTKYVPVETVRTEYKSRTDTVRQCDSIIKEKETVIRETNKSDSALLASLGIQLKEGQRAILVLQKELERIRSEQSEAVHDTIIKNDTIPIPYPVEGKVKPWEKVKLISGGAICGGVTTLAATTAIIVWMRRRYRHKE